MVQLKSVLLGVAMSLAIVSSRAEAAPRLSDAQKIEIIRELKAFVHDYETNVASSIEFASADAGRIQAIREFLARVDYLTPAFAEDDEFDGYYGGWPTQATTVVRDGKKVRLLTRPSRGNPNYDRYAKLMADKGFASCSGSELLCNPMLFGPGLCVSVKTRSEQQSAYRNCEKKFSQAGRTDADVVKFLNENAKDVDQDFAEAVAQSQSICSGKTVVTRTLSTCKKIAKRFASLQESRGQPIVAAPETPKKPLAKQIESPVAAQDATRVAKPKVGVGVRRESEPQVKPNQPSAENPPITKEELSQADEAILRTTKQPTLYSVTELDDDCSVGGTLSGAKRETVPRKRFDSANGPAASTKTSNGVELLKCSDRAPGEQVYVSRYRETAVAKPSGNCLRTVDSETGKTKLVLAPAGEGRLVGDIYVLNAKGKLTAYGVDDLLEYGPQKPLSSDLELQKGASLATLPGKSVFAAFNKKTGTTQVYSFAGGVLNTIADLGADTDRVSFAPAGVAPGGFRVAFQVSQGDAGTAKAAKQTSDIVVMDFKTKNDKDGNVVGATPSRVARVTTERDPGSKNENPKWNADGSLTFEHAEAAKKDGERVTVSANDFDFKGSITAGSGPAVSPNATCKVDTYDASVVLGYLWTKICMKGQKLGDAWGAKLSAQEASFYALVLDHSRCVKFAENWSPLNASTMKGAKKLLEGTQLNEESLNGLTVESLKAACDQISKEKK